VRGCDGHGRSRLRRFGRGPPLLVNVVEGLGWVGITFGYFAGGGGDCLVAFEGCLFVVEGGG
jgi:hypothetical protein